MASHRQGVPQIALSDTGDRVFSWMDFDIQREYWLREYLDASAMGDDDCCSETSTAESLPLDLTGDSSEPLHLSPTIQSPLLSLPLELKTIIFEHLLKQTATPRWWIREISESELEALISLCPAYNQSTTADIGAIPHYTLLKLGSNILHIDIPPAAFHLLLGDSDERRRLVIEPDPIRVGAYDNEEGLYKLLASPILRVCRQLRDEGLPVAVSCNIFDIYNSRVFNRFLKILSPQCWNHIRHIEISDPFFLCDEDELACLPKDRKQTLSREIIDILSALPRLQTLRFRPQLELTDFIQASGKLKLHYGAMKHLRGLKKLELVVGSGWARVSQEHQQGFVKVFRMALHRVLDSVDGFEESSRLDNDLELVADEDWESE